MAVQILSNPLLTYAPHGVDPTGMQLFTYAAGTNTKKATYTSTDKGTEHTNPIVLNSKGQPNNGSPVVIDGSYKFVVAPADDTDPPASGTVLADNYSSDLVSSVTGNFNLVTNGSFEDDTNGDGTPDGFTIAELTGGSIAIDTTDVAHGTNSLLFTSASAGGGTATSEDYFPVLAGSTVNGIVSVKSSSATNHNIVEVYWYTSSGTYLSKTSIYDEAAANPTSWTQYNTTMTVPATAVQAKLVLTGVAADSTTLASSVRFDDVKVQEVSGTVQESLTGLTATIAELNVLDGVTATTAELNILDGVTATTTEINTLDASAQAVTGFTYSNIVYIDDDGDSQGGNTFDIDAAIGAAWESVGPTGSGATNIWTALDAIPSSAKWIELEIFNDIVAITSAGYASANIYMRRNGSAASKAAGTLKSVSVAWYIATAGGESANVTTVKVPVTSRKFDVYYEITSTAGGHSESSYMKVIGFGV